MTTTEAIMLYDYLARTGSELVTLARYLASISDKERSNYFLRNPEMAETLDRLQHIPVVR